tara:strand:+ start:7127 stop:7651 length:525 start_codon:yes stop_codon:yes gene_type:complete
MKLGKYLFIGFILAFTLLLAARIFGLLGNGDPSDFGYASVPLGLSIVSFLIKATDESDQWFKGFKSILKLLFLTPLLWSVVLVLMITKIGSGLIHAKNQMGVETIYNMGDNLYYTMGMNLITAIIFVLLLWKFSVTEPLVTAVNVSGFCSFLLIITAIMNIHFYVELTTKPVLP